MTCRDAFGPGWIALPRRLGALLALVVLLHGCALLTMPFDDDETAPSPGPTAPTAPAAAAPSAVSVQAPAAPTPSSSTTAATPGPMATTSPVPASTPANARNDAAPPPPPAATKDPLAAASSTVPAAVPSARPASPAPVPVKAQATSQPGSVSVLKARPNPADKSFSLQVGAFKAEAAANARRDELTARLKEQGAPASDGLVLQVLERDGVYRVFVGSADSLSATRALKSRLQGVIPSDSFITKAR